jgi:hypothetical protein
MIKGEPTGKHKAPATTASSTPCPYYITGKPALRALLAE